MSTAELVLAFSVPATHLCHLPVLPTWSFIPDNFSCFPGRNQRSPSNNNVSVVMEWRVCGRGGGACHSCMSHRLIAMGFPKEGTDTQTCLGAHGLAQKPAWPQELGPGSFLEMP